ncbi:hypothetical protein GS399_14815 [Pedobacter sp. HMF7647]|uniref:Uncharacterized protein n=1 Tax=Hufsiella arboris TaxID=2695275 RepID=A0A7K1YDY8_9SPHI|nr:hypothetical protein [Hufsiella arboris]MXV52248.1 hypothetical protein [Hufsiella arboris]
MDQTLTFSGNTEDEVWTQLNSALVANNDSFQFHAEVNQAGKTTIIDVDIDPGGGFEGGYETTTLSAVVSPENDFRFAIHPESFVDEVGKFFGMEDIEIGYPEFDKKVIIKTNNAEKVKYAFKDSQVRSAIGNLTNFTLGIVHYTVPETDQKVPFLELRIEHGIMEPEALRTIYHVFYNVLTEIELK